MSLKETPLNDAPKLHEWTVEVLAKMIYRARVVHADLSEYNILNREGELVVIDCGQGVALTHPLAREFFDRDLKNMANYLQKHGTDMDVERLRLEVQNQKKTFEKKATKRSNTHIKRTRDGKA